MSIPEDKRRRRAAADAFSELQDLGRSRPRGSPPPAPASGEANRRDDAKYTRVLEVSASLASTLELTEILNLIVDGIIQVTGCERGFLMLKESDGEFSMHIGRTRGEAEWNEEHLAISRTIVARVVRSRERFVAPDLERVDDLKDTDSIHQHAIRSAFCLPLLYKDELIGVIYADSGHVVPQVLEADHDILVAFAAQAALAIANARQHGELKTRRDRLEEQNLSLRQQLAKEFAFSSMVSKNKGMLEVFGTVEKVAQHDISVLIQGDSGTGKELLARGIHERSPRRDAPMEIVNCSSIPGGLVESILFGHRRGAFTGAMRDKPGVFELADGGTLFLDEIGDMPLDVQPKLLRVLESKEFCRVGEEERLRKVDVRIIAATHMDLARAVEEGRFREDLFFRLNVAHLFLPPLRERPEDILPLATHFLERFAAEKRVPLPKLARDAQGYLVSREWKGNVRELRSAMEWAIVLQDEDHVIHADQMRRYFAADEENPAEAAGASASYKDRLRAFEEALIRKTLVENQYNITRAAEALDISRQQLHNKLRRLGISTKGE